MAHVARRSGVNPELISIADPTLINNMTTEAVLPSPQSSKLLRDHGIRVTQARLSVLSVLLDSGRALSHLELHDKLPDMDRVTLYRALDCLTDGGLAHKISSDDRVFRYSSGNELPTTERTPGKQHQHGHFKCTRCTRVFCLNDAEPLAALREQLEQSLQNSLGAGFQSHDVELTMKGWCADCAHSS